MKLTVRFWGIIYAVLFCSFPLSATGIKERMTEVRVVTDMQDRYSAMPETLPAVVVLPASATSGVPLELLNDFNRQLIRCLVMQNKVKPVLMNKYLSATFLNNKAETPFALLQALAEERYTVPLSLICKPFIFKNEQTYIIRLAFYSLQGSPYPIEIIRSFSKNKQLTNVINSCLNEFVVRYFTDTKKIHKKKVLIQEFQLEFLKLVELTSGEFEFVTTPFIQQADFTLKAGDDYFSLFLGYILSSTNMFETFRLADFQEFADVKLSSHSTADYIISGRVQLTEQIGFLYADLIEAPKGKKVLTVKHPLKNFSLPSLIDAYREICWLFAQKIFPADSVYLVPVLNESGNAFYCNDRLIGWNTLNYFFLPVGMHTIDSKPYINRSGKMHTYYVLLDAEQHIFTDREGKYAWNLLQK